MDRRSFLAGTAGLAATGLAKASAMLPMTMEDIRAGISQIPAAHTVVATGGKLTLTAVGCACETIGIKSSNDPDSFVLANKEMLVGKHGFWPMFDGRSNYDEGYYDKLLAGQAAMGWSHQLITKGLDVEGRDQWTPGPVITVGLRLFRCDALPNAWRDEADRTAWHQSGIEASIERGLVVIVRDFQNKKNILTMEDLRDFPWKDAALVKVLEDLHRS